MSKNQAVQGIRCLEQLGLSGGAPLDVTALARAEGLERTEVASLLGKLDAAGFIECVPDAPGCYRLKRPPSQIRVGEVWAALVENAGARRGGPTLQQVIDWEEQTFQSGDPAQAA